MIFLTHGNNIHECNTDLSVESSDNNDSKFLRNTRLNFLNINSSYTLPVNYSNLLNCTPTSANFNEEHLNSCLKYFNVPNHYSQRGSNPNNLITLVDFKASKTMSLNIYYQNVNGLRTKLNSLNANLSLHHYDIYMLTETWLNDSFYDAELGFGDYQIFRCDRGKNNSSCRLGGGVLIAVSKHLPASLVRINNLSIETLFVSLKIGKQKLLLNCSYFPPRSPADKLDTFVEILDGLYASNKFAYTIICGDFNLPHIDWVVNTESHKLEGVGMTSADTIINSLSLHNLNQFNSIKNCSDHILDLAFTNIELCSLRKSHDAIIVPVDRHHPPVDLRIDLPKSNSNIPITCPAQPVRCFSKTDFVALNQHLHGFDWQKLFLNLDISSSVKKFYDIMEGAMNTFIPKKIIKGLKFPIWMSADLKNLIFKKKIIHKQFKITKNSAKWNEFKSIRTACYIQTTNEYTKFIKSMEKELKRNPKNFWNFIKSKSTSNSNFYPTQFHFNNQVASTEQEISDFFAEHFSSVYSREQLAAPNFYSQNFISPPINYIELSEEDVANKLEKLKAVSSCGPHHVPPVLLKKCSSSLSYPLFLLFKKSLVSGIVPDVWKSSYIIPLFKSGDRPDIKNYRPIAKLSSIPKLLESIVYDKVSPILRSLICENQHGFISNRSTTSNLVSFTQFTANALEQKHQVDCLYFDYSKAFDCINLNILCSKLKSYGIDGPFHDWLSSFLYSRIQIVKFNNSFSKLIHATSGCQQGGHLSGLLFNLYINDIKDCIPSDSSIEFWLYADDLRVGAKTKGQSQCQAIQDAVEGVLSWSEVNRMKLNASKCYVMSFHRKKNPLIFNYSIGNTPVERVTQIRDLGVIFQPDLKFNLHICNITGRAMRALGFVLRNTKEFYDPNTLITLYFTFCRSVLEYASVIWSPSYKAHVSQIESVQRYFLRKLAYKQRVPVFGLDYGVFMEGNRLQSLALRRDIADIIILYKIINNVIDSSDILEGLSLRVPRRSTRNKDVFKPILSSTNILKSSVPSRLHFLGNKVSDLNLDFNHDTLTTFKRVLSSLGSSFSF